MINFDQVINRKNTRSVKWDGMKSSFGSNDLLPMWVADMDFQPPAKVLEAMNERVQHGVFGYTIIDDSIAEAIINWVGKRHNWEIQAEWLMYSPGVVPTIAMAIQAFTEVGDKVLLQSPVYTPFFNMIENNMREVVNSPLKLVNGRYEVDFADFEEKLKTGVKLFLLCSPHNPASRVWSKEELIQMAELCKKYDCLIVSDEIHSDLVASPYKHTPIASINDSLSDMVITCMAPSKTFNLAGLQASYMIISNQQLRSKMAVIQGTQGFHTLNTFGIIAMEAAYRYGEEWLDEVLRYIRANIDLIKTSITRDLPELIVIETEGTYLVWVDCRKTGLSDQELRDALLEKGKLAVNFGHTYGEGGEGFIRINAACPRSIIEEGLDRLKQAFS